MQYKKDMADRAQIFQPFDTLKGFRQMLALEERIIVPQRELMEDELEELDRRIHEVKIGMMVEVEYYDGDDYVQLKGMVSKIDLENRFIQIVKKRVNLDKIVWVELGEE